MNHENEFPPTPSTPGDAELEAQIVAWVAGEASPFMIAALESAVAARPELAVFKRRIEAVHGLVSIAARPDREPLRLSPERRAKLLKAIGVKETANAPAPAAAKKPAVRAKSSVLTMPLAREQPFWRQPWFYSAAACVVISIGGFWMLSTVHQMKQMQEAPEMVSFDLMSPNEDANMAEPLSADEEPPEGVLQRWDVPSKQDSSRMMSSTSSHAMVDFAKMEKRAPASIRPQLSDIKLRDVGSASAPAKGDRRTYGTVGSDLKFLAPGAAPAKDLAFKSDAAPKAEVYDFYNKRLADDGSTGVLQPFVVQESEPRGGYTATSTLAGTRVRTPINVLNLPPVKIRTELKETASSVSVADKKTSPDADARGNFLSKRKGGAPAAAPAVAEEDEQVVLSPFVVADSSDVGFLKKTTRSSGQKQPKRPDPSTTTAGMGPGGINPESISLGLDQAGRDQTVLQDELAIRTDNPLPRPAPPPPASIEEVSAAKEAVSTFSLHVSDVSFKLALAALASGTWPDRATIRPEEFYNAFDYGDPATAASEKISCRIEQAAHPFAQQRNLVRIAMRVPATGRGAGTPLHLTVLLDTSGSMERPDRRATVRAALATLVGLLGPADRLTVIGFARQPRLLAEALDGNHANQALDLLDRTPAEGGTNLEEALKLGSELARRQFLATAQNRIVLLTDGAANLGDADPDRLATAVEALRAQRIAFDACGVGLDGLDDTILEALTRKGDGRYYVLNSPESADAGFARQLAGALRPAAENVKVQVRFNPARVGHYRLVGFEKHRLREEDFRNDAVDAAELAAEEAAVAVYEIEAKPQGEGEVGEVFVRFRDAATKEMVERSWTLPYEARAAAFDRASPSIQLAGTAAMLAEKIRGGPAGDRVELDTLAPIVNALRGRRPDDKRLQELATLFEQLRRLEGK